MRIWNLVVVAIAGAAGTACTPPDIRVTLTGDASGLSSSATAHVTVWGFDANIADVPADEITTETARVRTLPARIPIALPDQPHQLIQYTSGPENAVYYLSVEIDSDGDGVSCESTDYRDVFDEGPGSLPLGDLQELTIPVEARNIDDCPRPSVPGCSSQSCEQCNLDECENFGCSILEKDEGGGECVQGPWN